MASEHFQNFMFFSFVVPFLLDCCRRLSFLLLRPSVVCCVVPTVPLPTVVVVGGGGVVGVVVVVDVGVAVVVVVALCVVVPRPGPFQIAVSMFVIMGCVILGRYSP